MIALTNDIFNDIITYSYQPYSYVSPQSHFTSNEYQPQLSEEWFILKEREREREREGGGGGE